MRLRSVVVALCATACSPLQRTAPAVIATRDPVTVYATAGNAFAAALAVVVATAPISHTDKAAGLIVLSPLRMSEPDAHQYADCGRMGGTPIIADGGSVSVTVGEAGGFATVRATALYTISPYRNPNPPACLSTGVLEAAIETAIKQRAEMR